MVPGSTLMYGSSLRRVTFSPRFSSSAPIDEAASPLPSELTTPPVTNTNLVFFPLTMAAPFSLYLPEAINARARSRSCGVSTPNPR